MKHYCRSELRSHLDKVNNDLEEIESLRGESNVPICLDGRENRKTNVSAKEKIVEKKEEKDVIEKIIEQKERVNKPGFFERKENETKEERKQRKKRIKSERKTKKILNKELGGKFKKEIQVRRKTDSNQRVINLNDV